jgi:cob(I)alamin adenosyltransferase
VGIYTKTGDDGTTGLLHGGRISKADPVAEAYGSIDETVAALGLARALLGPSELHDLILRLQRELFVVAADLATNPERRSKLEPGVSLVVPTMIDFLEGIIDTEVEARPLGKEFLVPGANPESAALDVARTFARRAERRAVELRETGANVNADALRYLNRLSDLLWVLARRAAGGTEPTSKGS